MANCAEVRELYVRARAGLRARKWDARAVYARRVHMMWERSARLPWHFATCVPEAAGFT